MNLFSHTLKLTFIFSALLSISCQQKPTQIQVTQQTNLNHYKLEQPIVLDVRSQLDFSVSHFPGAVSVSWWDFAGDKIRSLPRGSSVDLARRLALYGINPEKNVWIVGYGKAGSGEEFRLAWLLKTLGVGKTKLFTSQDLRGQIPRDFEAIAKNTEFWKPSDKEILDIEIKSLKDLQNTYPKFTLILVASKLEKQKLQIPEELSKQRVQIVENPFAPVEASSPEFPVFVWSAQGVGSAAVAYRLRQTNINVFRLIVQSGSLQSK